MLITKVQESLARKAQKEPGTPFKGLYRLVAHPRWLTAAAYAVLENKGANTPGPDGETRRSLDGNPAELVKQLSEELTAGVYQPGPVRRVYIPKANGKIRPLGIPNIRDRVVQEATRMVLEPILESYFLNCSTGFRPARRTMDAVHLTTGATTQSAKMWWVVEGDIKGCFDNIPHRNLMGVLKQYVGDRRFQALIGSFLAAGILEKGKVSRPNTGVPQGGIVSPLLTNMYLHEMDKHWNERYVVLNPNEKTRRRKAGLGNVRFIRYADDFVLLTNGSKEFAEQLKAEAHDVLEKLGLELSAEKTHITHISDGIDFLGFNLKRRHSHIAGKHVTRVMPTEASIAKFKAAVRTILDRSTVNDDPYNKIRALNQLIRGWAAYYQYGNVSELFKQLGWFVHIRFYQWLRVKHSNLRSHMSVQKFVMQTYYRTYKGFGTFGVSTASVVPMSTLVGPYYRITSWPKSGNPYLEKGHQQMVVGDPVPLPEPEQIWRGNTSQSAYALARLDRLEIAGHKCEKCGSTQGPLHADHVKPKSEGGGHSVTNLQILCSVCHQEKTAHDARSKTSGRKASSPT